jgi:hypothetical protein
MATELTNLLPQENIKAFKREYLIRLATVAIGVLTGVIIVQGVLLLPSYLYERQTVDTDAAQLASLSANLKTTQEQQVQTRLTALQAESTHLLGLGKAPAASTALRAVLAVPRPGITLIGFTYTPPAGTTQGSMVITGNADTREDLQTFDGTLGALPFVTSANLPISDYAKDTNIPFTITLAGSFLSS